MEYKKVPPEGGWGYLVAVGVSICLVIITGQTVSFGIVYGDFYEMIGGNTSNITFSMSMFYVCSSIAGLFANALQKRFSCRQVALSAVIVYVAGGFLTIFVNSLVHMLISYSLLQGAAFGTMIPAIYSTFNAYFVKRRLMVHFITKPFIAVGRLCCPFLIYLIREQYGFRGMLAILAALNTHMILATILMQPVKWHMKTIEVNVDITVGEVEKQTTLDEKEDTPLEVIKPLLNKEVIDEKINIDLDDNSDTTEQLFINTKVDHTNGDTSLPIKELEPKEYKRRKGIWHVIKNFFDLTLFQDPIYVNIMIGICLCEFNSNTFVALIPIHLENLGWTKADVSVCLSGAGFADLASTIVLALMSIFYKPKSRNMFLFSVLMSIPARIALIYVSEFYATFAVLSVLWFFRTWMVVNNFMVIAEHCEPQRFAAGFGLYLFAQGITMLVMGSVAGFVRDISGSYITCFNFLTLCYVICAVSWSAELIWLKINESKKLLS